MKRVYEGARHSVVALDLRGGTAMQAGQPSTDLLTEKVIAPLGLNGTTDSLGRDAQRLFAPPRDNWGTAVPT